MPREEKPAPVLFLVAAFLVFWGSLVAVQAEVVNRVVAVVNNEIITWLELEKKMRELLLPGTPPNNPEAQKQVLFQMIDEKLLGSQIRKLNLQVSKEVSTWPSPGYNRIRGWKSPEEFAAALARGGMKEEDLRARLKDQILRFRLISREIGSKLIFSEDQISAYYQKNRSKFEGGTRLQLAQITVLSADHPSPEAAKAKTEEIVALLRQGESFDSLARKFSRDPSAVQGGDLGSFPLPEIDPDLAQALAPLKPGETTPGAVPPRRLEAGSVGETGDHPSRRLGRGPGTNSGNALPGGGRGPGRPVADQIAGTFIHPDPALRDLLTMIISIAQGPQYLNQTVRVQGWVTHKRSSGRIRFLVMRDGSGLLQGVLVTDRTAPEINELFDQLTVESSLQLTGILRADPRAPGGVEMEIQDLFIFQRAQDYPITPKDHGTAFLMEHRHLWLRSSRPQAVLKIRHEVSRAIRDFLNDRGFIELAAPILTGGLRRNQHPFRDPVFRSGSGVLVPKRPTVYGSRGHGLRPGLLFRSGLPGGKIKDPPPSDRILDGGTGNRFCRSWKN